MACNIPRPFLRYSDEGADCRYVVFGVETPGIDEIVAVEINFSVDCCDSCGAESGEELTYSPRHAAIFCPSCFARHA